MGQREQAQRLTAGAADVGDALSALHSAAAIIEGLNRELGSDALRRVVTSLHTQYGRLVGVGEILLEIGKELPASELIGPLVPCRLVALNGAPITDMDLPPPSVGEYIQLGTNHPWRIVRVTHLREDARYRAVLAVHPEPQGAKLPAQVRILSEEHGS